MQAYCHKTNRYARGYLDKDLMIFHSIKQTQIKSGGVPRVCVKEEVICKQVDESFFEHFQPITDLELTVIGFEEDKFKLEFLVIRDSKTKEIVI
ncbi:MAG: hypothetical protein ABIP51_05540 [Bacteroidia bacterium]